MTGRGAPLLRPRLARQHLPEGEGVEGRPVEDAHRQAKLDHGVSDERQAPPRRQARGVEREDVDAVRVRRLGDHVARDESVADLRRQRRG